MYKLIVEPYCENCPEFEVNDAKEDLYLDNFISPEPDHYINHAITCKHMRRCSNMIKWLKKNKAKEIDNYDDSKQS